MVKQVEWWVYHDLKQQTYIEMFLHWDYEWQHSRISGRKIHPPVSGFGIDLHMSSAWDILSWKLQYNNEQYLNHVRKWQFEPVPGPISRTMSVLLSPAFSTMDCTRSGFFRICCPLLFWNWIPWNRSCAGLPLRSAFPPAMAVSSHLVSIPWKQKSKN